MLDGNNPEIDVDQIMQRLQEKVRLRRESRPEESGPVTAVDLGASGSPAVEQLLARAQQVANVGAGLPPMTRTHGLVRAFALPIGKIFLRLAQLITRDQRLFNLAALDALRTLHDRLKYEASRTSAYREDLAAAHREVQSVRAELAQLHVEAAKRAEETTKRFAELDSGQRAQEAQLGHLRTAISLEERRVARVLEEAGQPRSASGVAKPPEPHGEELSHLSDATYFAFEDEFRGPREEIKRRVAVYLPRLREASDGGKWPVLDVGCGRGELLEVLQAEGVKGSGVDSNRAAVDQCSALGLEVVLGDAFEVLRKIPDGSLGGVTALHVVEHVPFPLLLQLLDESLRVLRPGGVAIFETPNPKNILVGACNFYLDPTHRNPVHPQTLRHLAQSRGLIRVETVMLHPCPPQALIPEGDSPVAAIFNEYFYGPQDYAVVGYRP